MRRAVLFGVMLALAPLPTMADLVTFSFNGTVDSVAELNGAQNIGGIAASSTFSGIFQYDTTTTQSDQEPSPLRGFYPFAASPANFGSIIIEGLNFGSVAGAIFTFNDDPFNVTGLPVDGVSFFGTSLTTVPSGWSIGRFAPSRLLIELADETASIYDSDALPTSLHPANFNAGDILIDIGDLQTPDGQFQNVIIRGSIAMQPAAVPEPGSALLLSLAGIGLVADKFRKRRMTAAA